MPWGWRRRSRSTLCKGSPAFSSSTSPSRGIVGRFPCLCQHPALFSSSYLCTVKGMCLRMITACLHIQGKLHVLIGTRWESPAKIKSQFVMAIFRLRVLPRMWRVVWLQRFLHKLGRVLMNYRILVKNIQS